MTLEEKVHGLRPHPARPGVGHVSQACRVRGSPAPVSSAGKAEWNAMAWTIPVGIGHGPAARWNWPGNRTPAAERGRQRRDVGCCGIGSSGGQLSLALMSSTLST